MKFSQKNIKMQVIIIFSGFTKSYPAYSKEEAMRLSDKWEDQILLIMRFLDWKKQIKK
jgi:hypothetical protein